MEWLRYMILNIKQEKEIFNHNINGYSNFYLLKNIDNESNLFSELLFFDFGSREFERLSIFSSKNNSHDVCKLIESPSDFWENCIDIINNNYESLSHQYNKLEDNEIHKKNYMENEEVSIELNKLIKNKTLEEKRKMVVDFMNNYQEDKDIFVNYLNLVKNLIKDNTNTDLLSHYLKFIKQNKTLLSKKYGNTFDDFNIEINQYQALFDQTKFFQVFNYNKTKSEKEKLYELLNEILSLDKNNEDSLNKFINSKKLEFKNFLFNQPISFEKNKELFYCKNKVVILHCLEKIINKEKYDLIDKMKYCITQVLKRKLLDKEYIKLNNIFNMFIIILICIPQREIITDYNLNLIDNEDIEVTETKLKDLGFQYNKSDKTYKKNNSITIKKNEINLYNLKNLNLYLNTSEKNIFQIYELYKFEYLKKYYNDIFDENKVRNFISKILVSNVFKEAFSFFYGNDIKYPFIDENNNMNEQKAKIFLDNHLIFIPLKNETINAFTEKFSMETYIVLNYQFIFSTLNASENNLINDKILINKALTNGAIVAINDHEINHNYHNYYYCSKNGNESVITPIKMEINERERGNNMEKILFGRVLNNLTLRQALYILNEKNYEKSLNQFRKGFLELKEELCKCEGIFNEYSKIQFNIKELSDYMIINFKFNKTKFGYATIKLKNDVLGFPNFDENLSGDFDEEEFYL